MSRVRKYKSKSNQIKFIIRAVVIATMAICIIDLLVIAFPFYADKLPEGVSEKFDYASFVEANLVSTGMSIIGIAVAVWAGLNLIQVLEQKMFSELNEHVRQFEDERKSVYRKRFLVGLIHSDISLDKYFYAKLASLKESDFEDVSLEIFYELCLFQEADFFARADVKENMSRADYQYYAEKTDEIDQILHAYADFKSENQCMNVIKEYLISRKADIYFNIGYGVEGREKYQAFKKTIDLYEYLYPKLKSASWEEITTYNIGQIIGKETRTEVQIREGIINYCLHLLNTYAEAYSCLLFSLKDCSWIEMGLTWIYDKNTIISMKRVFDCILRIFAENESADVNKNPDRKILLRDEMKEFVYRNYGAFLERYYKAGFDVEGRNIRAIKHSVKCSKEKFNLNEEQTKQIFNLYVNAINTTLFSKDNMKAKALSFYALGSFWHKISEGKDLLDWVKQKKRYWNIKDLAEMLEKVEYYMDIGCREFPLKFDLKLIRTLVYRDKAVLKLIENHDEEAVSLYKRARNRYEIIRKFHGDELEQSDNKFYKTLKESMPELETLFMQKKESTMINNSGRPSIDKPWLKYYSEVDICNSSNLPKESVYTYIKGCVDSLKCVEKTAIEYFGASYTYRQLFEKSDEVAKRLKGKYHLEKGDRIAVCLPGIPEAIYLFLAANRLGIVVKMIDPRINEIRLKENIGKDCKLIFIIEQYADKCKEIESGKVIVISAADSMKKGIKRCIYRLLNIHLRKRMTWNNFMQMDNDNMNIFESKEIEEDCEKNPAVIIYTSGTTGIPKGAILSNGSINAVCFQQKSVLPDMKEGDSFLEIMPPFIAYGLVCGVCATLSTGLKLIMIPKFNPGKIDKLILKYRPNHLMGVPAFFEKLTTKKSMENKTLEFIKYIIVGGDRMNVVSEEKVNNFLKKHSVSNRLVKGYGMTELSSGVIINKDSACNILGSCGIPLIATDVMIFDGKEEIEKGYDEDGELLISGPSVMLGYDNHDEEEKKLFYTDSKGKRWVKTGDIAKIDLDGNITILDRVKRMIVRSDGHNVFPSQIEDVLMKKRNIVKECVVVGVKDTMLNGQIPVAFVVLDEREKNKTKAIRNLEKYMKVQIPPRDIAQKFICVDFIPYTSMGKIDYQTLQKMAEKMKAYNVGGK